MSQTPIFNDSQTLYRYVVVGALSIVVFIGAMLFWRSRVIERRLAALRPLRTIENGPAQRPLLYDTYLDGHGQLWHDIMPVSVYQIRHPPSKAAKHASLDVDPLLSAQLNVALMIAMPSPDPPPTPKEPPGDSDVEDDRAPPYVEFGVAKVDVPVGFSDSGQ